MKSESIAALIRSRCEPLGRCLIWQGALSECGMPRMTHPVTKRPGVLARALYWQATRGERHPKGTVLTPTCGDKLCLRCLEPMTPKESRRFWAERGAYTNPVKARKASMTRRSRSWITDEMVAVIREAPSAAEASRQTGVSVQHAWNIRAGRLRKDYSNPFAQLA